MQLQIKNSFFNWYTHILISWLANTLTRKCWFKTKTKRKKTLTQQNRFEIRTNKTNQDEQDCLTSNWLHQINMEWLFGLILTIYFDWFIHCSSLKWLGRSSELSCESANCPVHLHGHCAHWLQIKQYQSIRLQSVLLSIRMNPSISTFGFIVANCLSGGPPYSEPYFICVSVLVCASVLCTVSMDHVSVSVVLVCYRANAITVKAKLSISDLL